MIRRIIRVITGWLSRGYEMVTSRLDMRRFETKQAVLTMAVLVVLCALILIIRTFRLSLSIRKLKEKFRYISAHRREIWRMRRKSCVGSFFIILLVLAFGFLMIYFGYPRVWPAIASDSEAAYEKQASLMLWERFGMFGSFGLVSFIIVWLWAFSRRARGRGVRRFFTFIFLCCLIGYNLVTANNLTSTQKKMATLRITADDMFERANRLYGRKEYGDAEVIYTGLMERGEAAKVTDADILNNLALAQLQQEKNEEGLATMRRIFETENANVHHVINLLVAAHVNGIPSRTILDEGKARDLVMGIRVHSAQPADYVKVRNAIAYNITYMDMELDESDTRFGSRFGALFPDSTGIPRSISTGWTSREECLTALDEALGAMQSDEVKTYGQEDPDITSLISYFEALQDGGIPMILETSPSDEAADRSEKDSGTQTVRQDETVGTP